MAKKKTSKTERWILISDDDGHWYLIPASRHEEFDKLLYTGDEECEDFNDVFGEMYINGSPSLVTFTDPKIERKTK